MLSSWTLLVGLRYFCLPCFQLLIVGLVRLRPCLAGQGLHTGLANRQAEEGALARMRCRRACARCAALPRPRSPFICRSFKPDVQDMLTRRTGSSETRLGRSLCTQRVPPWRVQWASSSLSIDTDMGLAMTAILRGNRYFGRLPASPRTTSRTAGSAEGLLKEARPTLDELA
jgi:hypothetical protein